jgi:hypothetical protein
MASRLDCLPAVMQASKSRSDQFIVFYTFWLILEKVFKYLKNIVIFKIDAKNKT